MDEGCAHCEWQKVIQMARWMMTCRPQKQHLRPICCRRHVDELLFGLNKEGGCTKQLMRMREPL